MTETLLSALRRLLIDDYHGLKERLGRRFGSFDFASEVLHEAWLRLQRSDAGASATVVQNPRAYLYKVVLNVATDRQRAERSRLVVADVEAIHLRAQDDLDPARIAEARLELEALSEAINAMPPRRRAVFVAARLEGLPYKMIAERLGVTVRVVDRELAIALDHLSKVWRKDESGGGTGDLGSSRT
ncbi:RNA polymerase subunit sigma-24 [Bradyrhizobium sp. SK17]|uniref:RNA polymerase sigma factor n=1 Tax=Bradyrhizobium sp. SK17 TaxID=2057741 RepID=UPI000C30C2D2|nr:RNA polymerase sigma factor [Bradyrhizobium sp. SK17]AUC95049.1 RNA polymerase subunit sigma-24 [Bradyrhizobium sp. SK17]